ncbi:hypothetical protein BXO471_09345, partial [Xanthomonas oryzae pv. oryzae]
IRGKAVRTTVSDAKAPCPLDHVNRQFTSDRPNALWVSDFTDVSTWQGWIYVVAPEKPLSNLQYHVCGPHGA